MRFLILDTDYPEFLNWLYAKHPGLEKAPYKEQMQAQVESLFGHAGFYSSNLNQLGYEAHNVYINNEPMQKAWAMEHGLKLPSDHRWQFRLRRGTVPWVSRVREKRWLYDILAAQIKHYKPDVVLNLVMDGLSSRFLQEMKRYCRLLVGQIAAPLPQSENWNVYDLVVSSLPHLVEYFRSLGVPSELNFLGFEPTLLAQLTRKSPQIPVSFIGNFHPAHASRLSFLEHLCSHLEIQVWSSPLTRLRHDSPIRSRYVGPAWGIEMYQILNRSEITLNHHIDIACGYANNLRLYEATGVGTLLVTDWKKNLNELFEPGREVVPYRSPEECVELVRYYLGHEDERQAIARAGQARTLRDHTYYQRMQSLVEIVSRYL
jgi:spore maturation protein CgeB